MKITLTVALPASVLCASKWDLFTEYTLAYIHTGGMALRAKYT